MDDQNIAFLDKSKCAINQFKQRVTSMRCVANFDHGVHGLLIVIRNRYMELNGAVLNVNKPFVTSRKMAFPKDK